LTLAETKDRIQSNRNRDIEGTKLIQWVYFPQSDKPTEMALKVAKVFQDSADAIDSHTHPSQVSDEVLGKISDNLISLGFVVETGKRKHRRFKYLFYSG